MMVLQRTLVSGGLVSLLAIVASITAAAAPVTKQRIAIEERSKLGSFSGTFTLIPLTPGPLATDSGTFTFPPSKGKTAIRGGQRVTTFKGVDALTGRLELSRSRM